ncbi:hypothetical protein TNCV_2271301 [Trichonephila clavipes]|nr:hypothetical protein TNCV_2271301 [Trichonephila clavipes]
MAIPVRRLDARGTITTTSYRSCSAVRVRHLFSVEALLCCPVTSCARGTMTTTSYRSARRWCSSVFFSVEALSLLSGRVLGARGTMATMILPQPLGAKGVRRFSVESFSTVRSRLGHAER